MEVGKLIDILSKLPPETEVYFRKTLVGIGNIQGCDQIVLSTYGCFGQSIPCVIFEPNHFTPDKGDKVIYTPDISLLTTTSE